MTIHWFSPAPPARSGIADYTRSLVPFLARRGRVVVWSPVEAAPVEGAEVRRFDPDRMDWAALNRGRVVYHVGNSPAFHAPIWRVANRAPGLVVLHDLVLHHAMAAEALAQDPTGARYEALLARHHGETGRRGAASVVEGALPIDALAARYPLYDEALEGATGVIVHARSAFETLSRHGRWPIKQLPLPYALPEASPAPVTPGSMLVFGHLGNNRMIPELLAAMASFGRSEALHLDIAGALYNPDEISALIARLGLGGRVRQHGHLAEEALDGLIARAGMVLALRRPTMGEASHSVLRAWAQARPVVACRTGWYAEQGDALLPIDPDDAEAGLHRWMTLLLDEPDALEAAGRRGRARLEAHHDPDAYVEALLGFADRLWPQRALEPRLLERLTLALPPGARHPRMAERMTNAARSVRALCQPLRCADGAGRGGEEG